MSANIVHFTAIFAFVCYISGTVADVDCSKPPRHMHLHTCCQLPDFNDEGLLEACAEFLGPPMPPHPMTRDGNMPPPPPPMHLHGPPHSRGMHHGNPCLVECMFNETEVLDANGDLNQDKFEDYIAATMDDEELLTVIKESFGTCAEKISEIKDEIEEMSKQMHNHGVLANCSPFASVVYHCMKMEIHQNCPASLWNDTEECNEAREHITECLEKKSV